MTAGPSRRLDRETIVLGLAAALAGLACFVVPPHLSAAGTPEKVYGHPVLPWFALAFANVAFVPSMAGFAALGVVLGALRPERWAFLTFAAVAPLLVLHAVNIVGDWTVDPTDHNLLPFEFVVLGVACWPVLPAAGGAAWIARVVRRRRSAA